MTEKIIIFIFSNFIYYTNTAFWDKIFPPPN